MISKLQVLRARALYVEVYSDLRIVAILTSTKYFTLRLQRIKIQWPYPKYVLVLGQTPVSPIIPFVLFHLMLHVLSTKLIEFFSVQVY